MIEVSGKGPITVGAVAKGDRTHFGLRLTGIRIAAFLLASLSSCTLFGPDGSNIEGVEFGSFRLNARGIIDAEITGGCFSVQHFSEGEQRYAANLIPADSLSDLRSIFLVWDSSTPPATGEYHLARVRTGDGAVVARATLRLGEGSFLLRPEEGVIVISELPDSFKAELSASFEQSGTRLSVDGLLWCPH